MSTTATPQEHETSPVGEQPSPMEGIDILDEEGYPTPDALALITTWPGTPRELVEDLLRPIFEAYGGIQCAEHVRHTTGPNRPASSQAWYEVRLVTGGWSGCEDAISALEKGKFWFGWWQSSSRGGAYEFHIPTEFFDQPMGEWPRLPSAYERGQVTGTTALATALVPHLRETHAILAALEGPSIPRATAAFMRDRVETSLRIVEAAMSRTSQELPS